MSLITNLFFSKPIENFDREIFIKKSVSQQLQEAIVKNDPERMKSLLNSLSQEDLTKSILKKSLFLC